MNEQPKNKVLIIIIGILLVANIIMLAFFIFGNQKEKKDRSSRDSYVIEYLEKEVGFNAAQLARYDSLSKQHREQLRSVFNELSTGRKKNFKSLVEASFSDSAIDKAADDMHEQQKALELNMLKYLREVRNICTATQMATFDTGFYKIFGKRGSSHKEK
ncbi:MAG: hypothetical protein QM737_10780 [Ferruginibacter sp.]